MVEVSRFDFLGFEVVETAIKKDKQIYSKVLWNLRSNNKEY